MSVRVLLVDDHELIRTGLAGVLDLEDDLHVVGVAGSVAQALQAYDDLRPDVLVVDLQLRDGTGLDIVRSLRARTDVPGPGLVVLTMHAGDEQVLAAMQAGASGFVGKDAPSCDVVRAVRHAAVSPRAFVSSGLTAAVTRYAGMTSAQLSEREHRVLVLLAEGLGLAAIAERLHVSESTAKGYAARIYQKLGVENRSQALVAAMRRGLLSALA